MSSKSNNFKALFSSFKSAVSGEQPSEPTHLSLQEQITEQWRRTQIQRGLSAKKRKNVDNNNSINVCICAVIVDEFWHADIWEAWSTPEAANVDFLIHAKYPEKIPKNSWFYDKTLKTSRRPEWNDVKVVHALLDLLEEGLKKSCIVTHFVFTTESCIPITPAVELLNSLQNGFTYAHYYGHSSCDRYDEIEVWDKLKQLYKFPNECVHKALPGWITLCREHPQKMVKCRKYAECFDAVWAPEEPFFPTMLALTGCIPEQVKRKALTYVEWPSQQGANKAHPLMLDFAAIASNEKLNQICTQGYHFARKFRHVDISKWKAHIVSWQQRSHSNSSGDGNKKVEQGQRRLIQQTQEVKAGHHMVDCPEVEKQINDPAAKRLKNL